MPVINQAQALSIGLDPLAYIGVTPVTPPLFVTNNQRDPNVNDWQNFNLGTIWLNTNANPRRVWMLVSLQNNQAIWIQFIGGAGDVTSLRADDGNLALPNLGVINVLGPTGLTGVVFTTATIAHTLTINLGGQIPDSFPCNTGTAVPVAGVLNVLGDGISLTTTGVGNTITISPIGGTELVETLTGNTGGAVSPHLGNINVVGDAVGITIAGNPGTHTLTASLVGGGVAAQSFHPDHGANVVPTALGVVNMHSSDGSVTISNGGANTLNFQVAAVPPSQFVGFSARQPTEVLAVTGDGTIYTIIFPTVDYDTAAAYNSGTGTYTIPTTGYWHFNAFIAPASPTSIAMAQNGYSGNIVFSDGQTIFGPTGNPFNEQLITQGAGGGPTNYLARNWSGDIHVASGVTVTVQFFVAGGSKNIESGGNAYFNAHLIGT